ncbi:10373_t:CDS:10 [Funneliformis geosporum]|nr:10373_t:CDS:10 [Funneliformis geosporum]
MGEEQIGQWFYGTELPVGEKAYQEFRKKKAKELGKNEGLNEKINLLPKLITFLKGLTLREKLKEWNREINSFLDGETMFLEDGRLIKDIEYELEKELNAFKGSKEGKRKPPRIPRGSALLTTSGKLGEQRINHIIHACPGSHSGESNIKPTLDGVIKSVQNSLLLAQKNKITSIAFPLIGGEIFLDYFEELTGNEKDKKERLAETIMVNAINQVLNDLSLGIITIVFVDFYSFFRNGELPFQKAYKKIKGEKNIWKNALDNARLVEGNNTNQGILNYENHKCEAIVNAANLECKFGGGISGRIGKATGNITAIDEEARESASSLAELLDKYARSGVAEKIELDISKLFGNSVYPLGKISKIKLDNNIELRELVFPQNELRGELDLSPNKKLQVINLVNNHLDSLIVDNYLYNQPPHNLLLKPQKHDRERIDLTKHFLATINNEITDASHPNYGTSYQAVKGGLIIALLEVLVPEFLKRFGMKPPQATAKEIKDFREKYNYAGYFEHNIYPEVSVSEVPGKVIEKLKDKDHSDENPTDNLIRFRIDKFNNTKGGSFLNKSFYRCVVITVEPNTLEEENFPKRIKEIVVPTDDDEEYEKEFEALTKKLKIGEKITIRIEDVNLVDSQATGHIELYYTNDKNSFLPEEVTVSKVSEEIDEDQEINLVEDDLLTYIQNFKNLKVSEFGRDGLKEKASILQSFLGRLQDTKEADTDNNHGVNLRNDLGELIRLKENIVGNLKGERQQVTDEHLPEIKNLFIKYHLNSEFDLNTLPKTLLKNLLSREFIKENLLKWETNSYPYIKLKENKPLREIDKLLQQISNKLKTLGDKVKLLDGLVQKKTFEVFYKQVFLPTNQLTILFFDNKEIREFDTDLMDLAEESETESIPPNTPLLCNFPAVGINLDVKERREIISHAKMFLLPSNTKNFTFKLDMARFPGEERVIQLRIMTGIDFEQGTSLHCDGFTVPNPANIKYFTIDYTEIDELVRRDYGKLRKEFEDKAEVIDREITFPIIEGEGEAYEIVKNSDGEDDVKDLEWWENFAKEINPKGVGGEEGIIGQRLVDSANEVEEALEAIKEEKKKGKFGEAILKVEVLVNKYELLTRTSLGSNLVSLKEKIDFTLDIKESGTLVFKAINIFHDSNDASCSLSFEFGVGTITANFSEKALKVYVDDDEIHKKNALNKDNPMLIEVKRILNETDEVEVTNKINSLGLSDRTGLGIFFEEVLKENKEKELREFLRVLKKFDLLKNEDNDSENRWKDLTGHQQIVEDTIKLINNSIQAYKNKEKEAKNFLEHLEINTDINQKLKKLEEKNIENNQIKEFVDRGVKLQSLITTKPEKAEEYLNQATTPEDLAEREQKILRAIGLARGDASALLPELNKLEKDIKERIATCLEGNENEFNQRVLAETVLEYLLRKRNGSKIIEYRNKHQLLVEKTVYERYEDQINALLNELARDPHETPITNTEEDKIYDAFARLFNKDVAGNEILGADGLAVPEYDYTNAYELNPNEESATNYIRFCRGFEKILEETEELKPPVPPYIGAKINEGINNEGIRIKQPKATLTYLTTFVPEFFEKEGMGVDADHLRDILNLLKIDLLRFYPEYWKKVEKYAERTAPPPVAPEAPINVRNRQGGTHRQKATESLILGDTFLFQNQSRENTTEATKFDDSNTKEGGGKGGQKGDQQLISRQIDPRIDPKLLHQLLTDIQTIEIKNAVVKERISSRGTYYIVEDADSKTTYFAFEGTVKEGYNILKEN